MKSLSKRSRWILFQLVLVTVLGTALSVWPSRAAIAAANWNEAGIGWRSHDDGLKEAKAKAKPICLVFSTEWCPHCTNYSRLFSDPKVVEKSKSFVMIHLDRDKNKELSKQYSPDGEYIPRTYFLSPEGKLDPEIHAARDKYLYFYDESSPDALLAGMDAALKKLSRSGAGRPPAAKPK